MVKVCVEPATLFGMSWYPWNGAPMCHRFFSGFFFFLTGSSHSFFSSWLVAIYSIESLICPTILPIAQGRRDDVLPFPLTFVWSKCKQLCWVHFLTTITVMPHISLYIYIYIYIYIINWIALTRKSGKHSIWHIEHWTAVLTLLGLISSVYHDLYHWRLNQQPQNPELKLYHWSSSPHCTQTMPN